jgi:hypothetical protein
VPASRYGNRRSGRSLSENTEFKERGTDFVRAVFARRRRRQRDLWNHAQPSFVDIPFKASSIDRRSITALKDFS